MPFNKDITGFRNEDEFVYYLNNRQFTKLSPAYQELFRALYPSIGWHDRIICKPNFGKQKGDIITIVNGEERKISIKKGVKNPMHVEPIKDFVLYLIKERVSANTINELLKYHYADGTINGTGEKRLSASEYKINNQDSIDKANEELNNYNLISKLIERFVLTGNNSDTQVDAIIYGVTNDFLWATKEEVKYIILNQINSYSTSIHFSSLTYQPMNRCLNKNKLYEAKREYLQIKWYNISDDFMKILCLRKFGQNYYNILLDATEKYLSSNITMPYEYDI